MNTSGRHRRTAIAASAALAALALAGCSSSGGSGASSSAGGTAGITASGTVSVPASTAGSGATAGASATDVAGIKKAYTKFFAPNTPEKESLSLLQNGQQFKSAIEHQASGSMASAASVKVSKVTVTSPNTAKVTFTIYVNKQPMLKNQTGYAVKNNGTWQVSEFTFCQLLTLEGSAPAACKTPTATQTPQ